MKHITIVFSRPENKGQNRSKPKTKSSKYKIPNCTCDICGKVVKGQATLKLHKMAVHENLKPHVCDRCGQKYVRKAKLTVYGKCSIAILSKFSLQKYLQLYNLQEWEGYWF